MSTFTILVIIFIAVSIFRSISKYIKEQKPQSSGFNWGNYHSSRLRSILNTYNNFQDEDIIDSAVGFYLFSYNDDTREFIFIQEEGSKVIHHFKYSQLVSYNIRNTRDYGIFLDFKTTISNKTYISIECFNRESAIKKIPHLATNTTEIDNLYRLEQEKVEEIGDILQDILDENNETVLPPPYQDEIDDKTHSSPVIILPIEEEIKTLDIKAEPVPIGIEESTPPLDDLGLEEEFQEVEEIQEQYTPDIITEAEEQQEVYISEEESVIPEINVDNSMIQVSLSDIDEYSRGKFLDWEIQSAIGDAKVKGQKYIYLNSEQLEKVKS